jgi:hypothetical protein
MESDALLGALMNCYVEDVIELAGASTCHFVLRFFDP